MADIAEIQTGLAEIVEEVAGIDAAEVTPEKAFVDDLGDAVDYIAKNQ
jgi:acyl carrier protein